MKGFTLRIVKTVAACVIAGGLVMSGLGAAWAAPAQQQARSKFGIFGNVTATSQSSMTVQTKGGATVQLAVSGDTEFRAPGKAEVSLKDVAVGSRVAVLASGEANSMSALKVMLVPGEPQSEHRVLTVVEVTGKTVIAQDSQGQRIEVELDHEASADLKGQLVTFIAAKGQESNRFKAKAEMKLQQVVERLESHSQKLQAEVKVEANTEVKVKKERELAQLKARLEANMERHLNLFTEIIARAPEEAKASLRAALDMTLTGYKKALEATGESRGQAEVKLSLRTLSGTVEAVNAQTGEVKVSTGANATVTFKVTADTKISIGGQAGTLSNISAGDQVVVKYNHETMTATEIRVKTEAEVEGTIQSIDTTAGQMVIRLESGATLTVKLTSATKITLNHKTAAVADLKANSAIEVEYNLKTQEALKVEAETKAEVNGTVKSVNSAEGTVTILTEAGKEITLKIDSATRVSIQGLLFGLLGISVGMRVEAVYDMTTGLASEVRARSEGHGKPEAKAEFTATGTIGAVNPATGEVTIQLDSGGTLVLLAKASTDIELNGQDTSLANLKTGLRVRAKYNAETKVAEELSARSLPEVTLEAEAHGSISTVNTTSHKLVLQLQGGATKELTLTSETTIRIDGKAASEADLKAGMQAEVRYRTDTGVAMRINIALKSSAELRGTIKTVDALAGRVVIETEDGKTITITITPSTEVTLDGRASALLNLSPGASVSIELKVDGSDNVALRIHVQSKAKRSASEDAADTQATVSIVVEGSSQASDAHQTGTDGGSAASQAASKAEASSQASASTGGGTAQVQIQGGAAAHLP